MEVFLYEQKRGILLLRVAGITNSHNPQSKAPNHLHGSALLLYGAISRY